MSRNMGGGRYQSSGERSELADRVVRVNRVAKVVKGGRKFSFSALIVVGDISGGAMRAVIETAGIKDILTKSHGTNNPINTVRATLAALQQLRTAQQVADVRNKEIEQIVGRRLANAYRRSDGTEPAAAAVATPEVK